MAYNESDEKAAIQAEIREIEQKLASLDSDIYDISMQRKFLNHRLADLKYSLREIETGCDHADFSRWSVC